MSETLTARADRTVRSPAKVYDEQFVPALFRHWEPVAFAMPALRITAARRQDA